MRNLVIQPDIDRHRNPIVNVLSSRYSYGARRMKNALNALGFPLGRHQTRKLMKEAKVKARLSWKSHRGHGSNIGGKVNCSTDKSSDLIKRYTKKDKRVRCFKNKNNIGCTKTLNKLVEQAKGKYIARIDADDISFEDRLEKQFKLLTKHNYDVLGTNIIFLIL